MGGTSPRRLRTAEGRRQPGVTGVARRGIDLGGLRMPCERNSLATNGAKSPRPIRSVHTLPRGGPQSPIAPSAPRDALTRTYSLRGRRRSERTRPCPSYAADDTPSRADATVSEMASHPPRPRHSRTSAVQNREDAAITRLPGNRTFMDPPGGNGCVCPGSTVQSRGPLRHRWDPGSSVRRFAPGHPYPDIDSTIALSRAGRGSIGRRETLSLPAEIDQHPSEPPGRGAFSIPMFPSASSGRDDQVAARTQIGLRSDVSNLPGFLVCE